LPGDFSILYDSNEVWSRIKLKKHIIAKRWKDLSSFAGISQKGITQVIPNIYNNIFV